MNPPNPLTPQNAQQTNPVAPQLSYPLDATSQAIIIAGVTPQINSAITTAINKLAFGLNGFQVFTSGGTFTTPAGFTKFWVRAVGGGADGIGVSSAAAGVGNGGASGVYCESLVNLSGVSTVTVTIGADNGGDTKFGTYVVAPGAGSATTVVGTFQVGSMAGGIGAYDVATGKLATSGAGGSSPLGFGGAAVSCSNSSRTVGQNGTGYGSGGSGAAQEESGIATAGGTGTGGALIINW